MTKEPDKVNFFEDFNNAVDQFNDHYYSRAIAISHNDADGISSLHIIQNLLYKLNIDYDYFIYNRSVSWNDYLSGILSKRQSEKTAFIFEGGFRSVARRERSICIEARNKSLIPQSRWRNSNPTY